VLLTIAFVLLALWAVAALLPHGFGSIVHVLLLVGLMLLILAFAKGRDEALHGPRGGRNQRQP
jgi:hypothetical protein